MASDDRPARPAMISPTGLAGQQPFPATLRYTYQATIAITRRHRIYTAIDHALGLRVIVKQAIEPHAQAGGLAGLQLACEGAMLRFLARRHIQAPRYIGLFDIDGRASLAMTQVPGQTLESLHLAAQISPEHIVRLIARLCAVLNQLHALGYVHHDIKPSNIIVQPDFTPVLIDWGSAEAIRAPGDRRPGSAFTPAFVSPDQARGLSRPTNDIFALGMTLDTLVEWPGPRLAAIIAKAVALREPRYHTAAELGHDLAQLCLLDRAAGYVGLQAI